MTKSSPKQFMLVLLMALCIGLVSGGIYALVSTERTHVLHYQVSVPMFSDSEMADLYLEELYPRLSTINGLERLSGRASFYRLHVRGEVSESDLTNVENSLIRLTEEMRRTYRKALFEFDIIPTDQYQDGYQYRLALVSKDGSSISNSLISTTLEKIEAATNVVATRSQKPASIEILHGNKLEAGAAAETLADQLDINSRVSDIEQTTIGGKSYLDLFSSPRITYDQSTFLTEIDGVYDFHPATIIDIQTNNQTTGGGLATALADLQSDFGEGYEYILTSNQVDTGADIQIIPTEMITNELRNEIESIVSENVNLQAEYGTYRQYYTEFAPIWQIRLKSQLQRSLSKNAIIEQLNEAFISEFVPAVAADTSTSNVYQVYTELGVDAPATEIQQNNLTTVTYTDSGRNSLPIPEHGVNIGFASISGTKVPIKYRYDTLDSDITVTTSQYDYFVDEEPTNLTFLLSESNWSSAVIRVD